MTLRYTPSVARRHLCVVDERCATPNPIPIKASGTPTIGRSQARSPTAPRMTDALSAAGRVPTGVPRALPPGTAALSGVTSAPLDFRWGRDASQAETIVAIAPTQRRRPQSRRSDGLSDVRVVPSYTLSATRQARVGYAHSRLTWRELCGACGLVGSRETALPCRLRAARGSDVSPDRNLCRLIHARGHSRSWGAT
jgi:hypothetical protein